MTHIETIDVDEKFSDEEVLPGLLHFSEHALFSETLTRRFKWLDTLTKEHVTYKQWLAEFYVVHDCEGLKRFLIQGETCLVKFAVLNERAKKISLGIDFLPEYGGVLELGANKLTLRKPRLTLDDTETIPPAIRVLTYHVSFAPR
ncbi:hypothetical protein HPB47_021544 [Ixodes persulcatus]|uniref:Uncharacterized protein n=1 Tax=Ixodes persulcatus TaxID=34615 RepID=A0AC60QC81_IXOPE|nr:hypothetical protein HPB47_021544 [Ixodes persulcatus]